MTRGDEGGVVFVVEGGAAEVGEPHRGVVDPPLAALLGGTQKQPLHTLGDGKQQIQIIAALWCEEMRQQLKETFRAFSMLS